jgi:hypothetical protein
LNKVTVRIWSPERMGFHGKFLWNAGGVGHASISLKVEDRKHYITWMAHGSPFAGMELNAYKYIDTFTKADDKENMEAFFESSEPTYKVKLPAIQPNSPAAGLDAAAIEQFWLDRLANRPKYAFLSKRENCTGCVADALRAGGLERFVPAPSAWFVQDAKSLLAWVLRARDTIGGTGNL